MAAPATKEGSIVIVRFLSILELKWTEPGSNRRPIHSVDRGGFEPPTRRFSVCRSTGLSYLSSPMKFPIRVQTSVNFRVTPTTKQDTLADFRD